MAEASNDRSSASESSSCLKEPEVMLDIPWFHPNLSRHQAEAELANCDEGIYLLRPCTKSGYNYSLDVKCAHSVKHFKVSVENDKIQFGQEEFFDLKSFLNHFDNCPLIGDDTGDLSILKYSYPRDVDEMHDYQLVSEHFLSEKKTIPSFPTKVYSLVSKEGYLIKLGAVIKSWRKRWFVLKGCELHYYSRENDRRPIKSINIKLCTEVAPCEVIGKDNVFRLVLPNRTFYLQAPNVDVMSDWMGLLKWKMDEVHGLARRSI